MFKKISPRKISDEIIEQFKSLLSGGQLKPGDELPSERELAELIGVSRPSLREALNVLQVMGYVEIRPRSRIIVKSLAGKTLEDPLGVMISEDISRLFELLEIRRALEGWAAAKAAERAHESDLRKLGRIVRKDLGNLENNTEDAQTDADLHMALATATHNTLFSHLMASCYRLLWDAQKMSREKIFRNRQNRRRIAEQHRRIYEAIRRRDPEEARKAAQVHIDFVEEELRKIIGPEKG